MQAEADDDGLRVPRSLDGTFDVVFDGAPVWSFTVEGKPWRRSVRVVRWPDAMRRYLDGVAEVELRSDRRTVPVGTVSFGSGSGRVQFRDKRDFPVVIDKWGIAQRPFETRDVSVRDHMAAQAEQVMAVLREECGIESWMAFGTLLGAARSGGAIGHDSDVDLLYLSAHESPHRINAEMYGFTRALRRRGFKVVPKNGSFITVLLRGPDGAPTGIDLYAAFYVGSLLHESATVRQELGREAILPLGTLPFEGRHLPAPADPDAVLTASYGSSWRVPDPSFVHRPGHAVTSRFDGWFGSLMTSRRVWETHWGQHPQPDPPSATAQWATELLPVGAHVLEVGCGNGGDAVALARSGLRVTGVDYARGCFRQAGAVAKEQSLRVTFRQVNLYDLRDALTLGALVRRQSSGPRAVYARDLVDAVEPHGRDAFWRLASVYLRGGGTALLEFRTGPARAGGERFHAGGGVRRPVTARRLEAEAEAAGGRVVLRERVTGDDAGPTERWRWVVQWPTTTGSAREGGDGG